MKWLFKPIDKMSRKELHEYRMKCLDAMKILTTIIIISQAVLVITLIITLIAELAQ